jgi:hypothetical protein
MSSPAAHAPKAERNVLGRPLEPCSTSPMTGFFRTGSCETSAEDAGRHLVCARMTSEFLAFSKARGNDLSTPRPGFRGLVAGDQWCLCASRWQEAFEAGVAPAVRLSSTHERALEVIDREALLAHALDGEALN